MYTASSSRYSTMKYHRCGNSGIMLPEISLGMWHNFGDSNLYATMKAMCFTAFDNGITHFDLANNYGPLPGSAEKNFGRILREEMGAYRDEMIISSKAGYGMWEGPYGDHGSRKYLIASLNQSLQRLGLDYVDIFYHHRPDPETPLEETMCALDQIVRSGKALYAGLSNYNGEQLEKACAILTELRTPFIINQNSYSILNRAVENNGLKETTARLGKGLICFCPLAQGLLTNRYLNGIPADSRMRSVDEQTMARIRGLKAIADERGESLACMSLKWLLKDGIVTSVLIGASRPEQIIENLGVLNSPDFTPEQLAEIDRIALS